MFTELIKCPQSILGIVSILFAFLSFRLNGNPRLPPIRRSEPEINKKSFRFLNVVNWGSICSFKKSLKTNIINDCE